MSKENVNSHRELALLDALRRVGGFSKNSELASVLGVSEETVRRTIKSLSKTGSVARVHGGAYLVGTQREPSFFRRFALHPTEKRLVAREVARSIADGMTLFLDVGSTTAFVAEELRTRFDLTVATNSVRVAQTLVGHNNARVFLLGGEMQADALGAFGHATERQVRRFCFDLAVFSVDALSAGRGFLYNDPAEASLSAVVSECADATMVAMTHHKFGETAPHRGFDPARAEALVTDRVPDADLAAQLAGWGIAVRAVAQEAVPC